MFDDSSRQLRPLIDDDFKFEGSIHLVACLNWCCLEYANLRQFLLTSSDYMPHSFSLQSPCMIVSDSDKTIPIYSYGPGYST